LNKYEPVAHRATTGSAGGYADWPEHEQQSTPTPPLTRQQAQALVRAQPSISPWRVVAAQALAGVCCVAAAAVWSGSAAVAWSALYGAAATVVPSCLLARGMTRRTSNPMAAAAGFMFWEMLKLGASIAMLVIAAKVVPRLSWPALLATMVVCIKVNWVALLWRARRPDDEATRRDGS
jgi:ATP synthase protein I